MMVEEEKEMQLKKWVKSSLDGGWRWKRDAIKEMSQKVDYIVVEDEKEKWLNKWVKKLIRWWLKMKKRCN
jgi:hypothetical protein